MTKSAFLLSIMAGPVGAQQSGVTAQAAPPPPVMVSNSPAPAFVTTPSYPAPAMSVPMAEPPSTVIMAVPLNPGTPRYVVPTVPFPTTQPSSDIVRPPEPRKPLQDYITAADYPASARAMHAEGWVDLTLTVGVQGRVEACTVTYSSGSSALDFATCRLMRSRARFTPAIDSHGNPAVATFSQDVEWKLPSS